MTQESLAEAAGVSYEHLNKLERGAVGPSFAVISRLAGALGVKPASLFLFPEGAGTDVLPLLGPGVGSWELDRHSQTMALSEDALILLGYPPSHPGSLPLDHFLETHFPESTHPFWHNIMQPKDSSCEDARSLNATYYLMSGEERVGVWSFLHCRADDDGAQTAQGLLVDLTDLATTTRHLDQSQEQMERRVQERTGHLDSVLPRLRKEVDHHTRPEGDLEFCKRIVHGSSEAMAHCLPGGMVITANTAMAELLQISPEETAGRHIQNLPLPQSLRSILELSVRHCAQGERVVFSRWVDLPGGRSLFLELTCVPSFDEAGDVNGVSIHARDASLRYKSEKACRASESRFKLLSNLTEQAVLLTRDDEVVDVNLAATKLFDRAREECVGTPIHELLDLSQAPASSAWDEPVEAAALMKDGTRLSVDVRSRFSMEDDSEVRVFTVLDISRRKRMVQELLERQDYFRQLFENAPLPYQSLDADGMFLEVNSPWLRTMGYTREEIIGRWFGDVVAPEFLEPFENRFATFLCEGAVSGVEFDLMRKDGSCVSILLNGNIQRDADGAVVRTHCIFSDVTESKNMLRELKESENRFRVLFESCSDGLFVHDLEGRFTAVNDMACSMLGYSHEELLHMTVRDVDCEVAHEPRPNNRPVWEEAEHVEERPPTLFETAHQCKDGSVIPVEVSLSRLCINNHDRVLAVVRDITERRRLQTMREDVEKMLRHDLRSPLVSAWCGLNLLQDPATEERAKGPIMEEMVRKIGHMMDMLDNSRDLHRLESHTYTLPNEQVRLTELLRTAIRELENVPPEAARNVTFSLELDDGSCTVMGCARLLHTMAANLLRNAAHATSAGGNVEVWLHSDNGHAVIELHNDLPVPMEIRDYFFDKYVTAGKREGTGLGTYLAKLIAEAHRGDIRMQTSTAKGTTITVRLPAAST